LEVKLDEAELGVVEFMEHFGECHRLNLFGHDHLKVNSHFVLISFGSNFVDDIANGIHKEIVSLDKSVYLDGEVSIHELEEVLEALEADLVGRLLESMEFAFVPVETFAFCHVLV
jgi:hypothetical protein